MKVKSVILDTTAHSSGTSNPALWDYNHNTLLDYQIKKILSAGRSAIVVIGLDGDELLRKCPKLDDCDLVYNCDGGKFSGLISGLHGSGVCSFYLPVHVPYPHEAVWLELERDFLQLPYQHQTHVLKPHFEHDGFPWLITKQGRDLILNNPKIDHLDLRYKEVPISDESISKIINNPSDLNNI